MNKAVRTAMIVFCTLALAGGLTHFINKKITEHADNEARTLYEGFVQIEEIDLSDLTGSLEDDGCQREPVDFPSCSFHLTTLPNSDEQAVEIFPNGPGFGPVSFYVTKRKIWAQKDIPGSPDAQKFTKAIREDVRYLQTILPIREQLLTVTKTQHPWTVLY